MSLCGNPSFILFGLIYSIIGLLSVANALSEDDYERAEFFVSRSGFDHSDCGNISHPCGTLYAISQRILASDKSYCELYVIDGQNETQIQQYHDMNDTDSNDPCLPLPFYDKTIVSIFFNDSIKSLNDWYPSSCIVYSKTVYQNKYFFMIKGDSTIKFDNLIINDYIIAESDNLYGIIQQFSQDYYGSYQSLCNNCIFSNIVSYNSDYPLIHLNNVGSFTFNNASFNNIVTVNDVILSEAVHSTLRIQGSMFTNISSASSILRLNISDWRLSISSIYVEQCDFNNISVLNSIINDERDSCPDHGSTWITCKLNITNTNINIISGSILTTLDISIAVTRGISEINILNTSITAHQLYSDSNIALLSFKDTKNIINLLNIDILYIYNADESCDSHFECKNAISSILNYANIFMQNMTFNMNMIHYGNDNIYLYKSYSRYSYGDDAMQGCIMNVENGNMMIQNVKIEQSINRNLISNEHYLSIDNLYFTEYNLNALSSFIIINMVNNPYNSGTGYATHDFDNNITLILSNSHFFGGDTQIYSYDGANMTITNSIFEMGSSVIWIDGDGYGTLLINDSVITNYNKSISKALIHGDVEQMILINNKIYGYSKYGLLYTNHGFSKQTQTISLINNSFSMNTMNGVTNGVINIGVTLSTISIVGNKCWSNAVVSNVPWIYLSRSESYKNYSICLSGNILTNFAIYAYNVHITSCFRPQLIEFITNETTQYSTDTSLIDNVGYFMVYTSTPIIYGRYSIIVLDNNHIIVSNDDINGVTIGGVKVIVSLFDSYISNDYDVLYNDGICNAFSNDRMANDIQYISILSIFCGSPSENTTTNQQKSLNSSNTTFVNYSLPLILDFNVNDSTYYPGERLTFEYYVTDIWNNTIPNNIAFAFEPSVSIELSNKYDAFPVAFDIDVNGNCQSCDIGSIIHALSMKNINDRFIFNISMEPKRLILRSLFISLIVVGCPKGYGADQNNFICAECNTNYYNLDENTVERCKPCNADENDGIECRDGTVLIMQHHWIDVGDNAIISARCISDYCCNKRECDYIYGDKDSLCHGNRNDSSKLCTKCNDGYSESMTNNNCVKCKNKFYFSYLLLPIALSLGLSIFLIRSNMYGDNNNDNKSKYVALFNLMKIILLKNILYYEQGISQILITGSISVLFASVSSILNVSFSASNSKNEDEGWCFYDGLSAKGKIAWDLFVPLMITILIASSYIYSTFISKNKTKIDFGKTVMDAFLMIIGKILDVLLRLLSCTSVNASDETVHSYFADEECYGVTWWCTAISFIIIVISFSAIFIKLKLMDISERQNSTHFTSAITYSYKPQYYYWEFVIFIRRMLIALFAVSVTSTTMNLLFSGTILFFTSLQHSYNPFIIDECNKIEFTLLLCFAFITIVQFPLERASIVFINFVISFLILLPFGLMVYYIYGSFKKKSKHEDEDNTHDNYKLMPINDTVKNDLL